MVAPQALGRRCALGWGSTSQASLAVLPVLAKGVSESMAFGEKSLNTAVEIWKVEEA